MHHLQRSIPHCHCHQLVRRHFNLSNWIRCHILRNIWFLFSGHTFCEDCIEVWKTKQHNPTCPICRAEIVTTSPNQALDGCIEKFIDNFYPDAAKANRAQLLSERTAKKEAREKAKKAREQGEGRRNDQHMLIGGILSANTRRRIDRVLSSDDSDNSWDTTFARLGVSPSRFSISSAASTTSYNGSFAGHTPVQWSSYI